MLQERRRSQRSAISRYAKIQVASGALPRDCLVTNISEGGVRLHVEGFTVPDGFMLFMNDGSGARPRGCKVVWRLGYELGAKFTDMFGPDYEAKNAKTGKEPVSA